MDWTNKELKVLLDKYDEKIKLLTMYRNISDEIRHDIYRNNPDWFNSPDEEEVNRRCEYGDDINDKLRELGILLDNVFDSMDKLNDAIDECEVAPYDEKYIKNILDKKP